MSTSPSRRLIQQRRSAVPSVVLLGRKQANIDDCKLTALDWPSAQLGQILQFVIQKGLSGSAHCYRKISFVRRIRHFVTDWPETDDDRPSRRGNHSYQRIISR